MMHTFSQIAKSSFSDLQTWISTIKLLPDEQFLQAPFSKLEQNKLSDQDLTLEDLLKQLD